MRFVFVSCPPHTGSHVCHKKKKKITSRLVSSFNSEKQNVHGKEEVVIVDVRERRMQKERKNPFFFYTDNQLFPLFV